MARIRTIKPEFFSHEVLASKSAHARLLAIGLLTLADCEGRLRWVPMQIHSQVFPWEESVQIEMLLGELVDASYVVHYEVDGKRYVEILNFKKHQRLSGKEAAYESRIPPRPSADEKTNENVGEIGEATGTHPSNSPGSGGNPLGTGEQGNIGTGEHRKKLSLSARENSSHWKCEEFQDSWFAWLRHIAATKGPMSDSAELQQLYELSRFATDEATAIVRFSTGRQAKNLILNGDHKQPSGDGGYGSGGGGGSRRRRVPTFEEGLLYD